MKNSKNKTPPLRGIHYVKNNFPTIRYKAGGVRLKKKRALSLMKATSNIAH